MSSEEFEARARLPGRVAWVVVSCLLTLGVASAVSCGQLIGDVEVGASSLRPIPGDGPTIGGRSCELGETRCNGALVEYCYRVAPERDTGWLAQQDCVTAELCVSGPSAHCLTRTCDRDEASCLDAVPRRCNAGQNGWDALPACENAAHCSTNPAECAGGAAPCCLERPCRAGALRCNQAGLERCLPDESGWASVDSCATADLCLGGLATCSSGGACACPTAKCEAGETRCTGTALERCNAGQTGWDVLDTCATPELCSRGRSNSPPICTPPACAIGDHICTDAGLLRSCKMDRSDFEDQEPCINRSFCNAGDGVCDLAPCEPGEVICNGAQIQVCAEDRSGFTDFGDACATADLCNDADPSEVHCDDPRCDVDQFDCFGGNQLQTCNDGRTGFVNAGFACSRPDLCSADRRRCDFCVPGRQECNPAQSASRVCSLTGNFFGPETFCPLGCVAGTGTCQTCAVGSYVCTNGNLSRCNDGRSFTPLNRSSDCSGQNQVSCFNGTVLTSGCPAGCDVARSQCNQCSGAQRQCAGAGFQQCTNGVFGPVQACPDDFFCAGQGTCQCNRDDLRCAGGDLELCTGTAYVPTGQCSGPDGDILSTCVGGVVVQDQCDSDNDCEDSRGPECDGGGRGPGRGR